MIHLHPLGHALPALLAALILTACGPAPRVKPTTWEAAGADRTVRELLVVKVWDMVNEPLGDHRNMYVSHYVEVDVLNGPDKGRQLTLPYDSFRHGNKPPPSPGSKVVVSPSEWVSVDPRFKAGPAK